MTDTYLGGAVSSPAINYTERLKYLELARRTSKETGALFLDTINDKKLYGMADNQFYIVTPNPEPVSFGDYSGDITGLNYVVSQFNTFREEYLRAVNTTDLRSPDIVSGLLPKKSYVSFDVNYRSYQDLVEEVLVDVIIRKYFEPTGGPPPTYRDFLHFYRKAIFDEEMENQKVTKTGYVLSPFSSCFESGLYIDLSPGLSPEIDSIKATLLTDENFRCYAQTATRHGFYVDLNCPWRLVLNLNAKVTRSNILNNNPNRPFYGFYRSEYLQRVGYGDYWILQGFLARCYTKFLENTSGGEVETLANLSPSTAGSVRDWLELYLLTRFREIGIIKLQDFQSTDQSENEGLRKYFQALATCYEMYDANERTSQEGGFDFGPLTSRSGPIGYIESICAEELKRQIMQTEQYLTQTSQEFSYQLVDNTDDEYSFEEQNS